MYISCTTILLIGLLFIVLLVLLIVAYIQKKRANVKLTMSTQYDTLTKIYNRRVLMEDLSRKVKEKRPFAILMFDLDGFKGINDVYGHNQGDEVLKELARRMNSLSDDFYDVYRLAGDEFMAIVSSSDSAVVEQYVQKMREMMKKPFLLSNQEEHFLHTSMGVAQFPQDADNETNLIAAADKAMYYVKNHGKNGAEWYKDYLKYDERMKQLQELDKSELQSRVFEGFAITSKRRYVYLCNMQTGISRWSKNAVDYFNLPGEYFENAGDIWGEHIHPNDREKYFEDIGEVFSRRKERHEMDYRVMNRLGEYVFCTCQGVVLEGKDGKPDLFLGTIENHSIVDNVDATTNLYNIVEFWQNVRKWKEQGIFGAILLIGVDNFSEIDRVYGYATGDRILKEVGEQIMEAVKKEGSLFRMEGVSFAYCTENTSIEHLQEIYQEIQNRLRHNIYIGSMNIAVTVSCGAVFMNEEYDEYALQMNARYALECSKHKEGSKLVVFDKEMFKDGICGVKR